MQALVEEQNARVHGQTTGKIQSASGSKQGLSFKVLQWLTGTDSEDNSETASNCKSVCSLWRRIQNSLLAFLIFITIHRARQFTR